ncbi:hypothetical protein [Olleya sp.]|jgi:hypothetical protein|uniref:hypothetical protein n=1 Tax=Olleya sp. TaxID=1906788 RepID=UPI0032D8CE40
MQTENNNPFKPLGLKEMEELYKDFLGIRLSDNHPFSVKILNDLIIKLEIIIKKLNYNTRLPWYDIEKEVIDICKMDKFSHGVNIKLLFTSKFGVIDESRLSNLKVSV